MQYVVALILLFSPIAQAETREKVAIVDTGISSSVVYEGALCRGGHKDFSGTGIEDRHGHGTMIALTISQRIDPALDCIMVIKWIDWDHEYVTDKEKVRRIAAAVKYAVKAGAKVINLSLAGPGAAEEERTAISLALKAGVVVAVAAGNEGKNLTIDCNSYPACYAFKDKNFHVVANYKGFVRLKTSNWGGPVNEFEDGGEYDTSRATAVFTGNYVRMNHEKKCDKHMCPAPKRSGMRGKS